MRRYWVMAPYDSTQTEIFDKAWEYDLKNGTLAIGWKDLGDISRVGEPELRLKFTEVHGKPNTKDINAIWKFYHEISARDVIIARRGRKKIVGIGTVTGTAFYDEEKGKQRVGDPTGNTYFYPNFIKVEWERREIEFDRMVFCFYTIYEISEDKYQSLVKGTVPEEKEEGVEQPAEFVLEKYLEDFVATNFRGIFKDRLELYVDSEGNVGQQYPTDIIGNIDILAKEPGTNSYVVIELKKGRESDRVVGQTLRYMGWVKENLCQQGENVKGLIICKDKDERLDYALKMVPNIEVKFYKVGFELMDSSQNVV